MRVPSEIDDGATDKGRITGDTTYVIVNLQALSYDRAISPRCLEFPREFYT